MIFIEVGAAVDIARAVGFVTREEIVLRNALEKARMMAMSPTSTVSVFVDVEYEVSVVVVVVDRSPVVFDITKEKFDTLKVSRQLYSH